MAARPVLDREQTRKAVTALLKYVGKEKAEAKELFDDDEFLYVVRVQASFYLAAAQLALSLMRLTLRRTISCCVAKCGAAW